MTRAASNFSGMRRAIALSAISLASFAIPASAASAAPVLFPIQAAGHVPLLVPSIAATLGTESCAARAFNVASDMAAQPLAVGTITKASAVLGGAVSALEATRAQQLGLDSFGPLIPNAAPASVAVTEIKPLTPALAAVRPTIDCVSPGYSSRTTALTTARRSYPNEFLASRKIAIGKTGFDASWDRVSLERLTLGDNAAAALAPGAPLENRLESINRWVNHTIVYADDQALFNKADYWAGPRRTMKLGKGDCEDIALVKMHMLLAAGVAREDMFLTIARDLVRRADHAVLIVRTPDGFRMLDNATDTVLDASQPYDYQPVLSFNGRRSFLHGY